MPEEKNIYQKLLEQGYSTKEIHAAMHTFMLLRIKEHKQPEHRPKNRPNPLSRLAKNIRLRKAVIGKALSLLKMQFAKKPKNPV